MRYRDLLINPITDQLSMVVACDVSASIGEKELDTFKIPASIVAAYTLRVVLFELLSFGVQPHTIISLVGNDFDTIGIETIKGLKGELKKADLSHIAITGSTEDNMEAKTTSIGITALAVMEQGYVAQKPVLKAGDYLARLGHPWCGPDVIAHETELPTYQDLKRLCATEGVVDVLPVGSKGTIYEAKEMVKTHHGELVLDAGVYEDPIMHTTAGPATCLVVGIRQAFLEDVQAAFPTLIPIGRMA